jgi:hypothetical protein
MRRMSKLVEPDLINLMMELTLDIIHNNATFGTNIW